MLTHLIRHTLRSARWLSVLLVSTLAAGALLGAGNTARASDLKKDTIPRAVFVVGGGTIGHMEIIVREKFWKKPEHYSLKLILEEGKIDGTVKLLQAQEVVLSATTFVLRNPVTRQVVVDVLFETDTIAPDSCFSACAQVMDLTKEGDQAVASEELCATLVPIPDL